MKKPRLLQKKYFYDLLFIVILLVLTIFFFLQLFYPKLSLFITSEIGVSDIWQFNIPVKKIMSEAISTSRVPLWTSLIGTGFPIFAESQMGFLNLFNQLIYRFFSFMTAYNLMYIIIYFFSGLGTYLYLKSLKLSNVICFLGGFLFTFSGFFITHISHQNMILAASYLPWLLLNTNYIINKKSIFYSLTFILLISQQIFSGYFQITVISLLYITIYYLLTILKQTSKEKNDSGFRFIFKNLIYFLILIFLGFVVSAAQILPSLELIDNSVRKGGLDPLLNTYYSYPIKHLVTLINPFLLGSPKNGTYPHFQQFDGSIFWENTGYIGILPLITAVIALVNFRKSKIIINHILILLTFFLLMSGKYSPLYFFHTIPPFNTFRIPSRYLLGFIMALVTLSCLGLERIEAGFLKAKKNIVTQLFFLVIASIFVLDIIITWRTYQPTTSVERWFKDPEIARFIKLKQGNNQNYRIFSILDGQVWIDYFLKNGWNNKDDYYFFRNELAPNYNIIPSIPQYWAYTGYVNTRRETHYRILIDKGISIIDKKSISISSESAKLLGNSAVKYIITPRLIVSENFIRVYSTKENPKTLPSFHVYENVKYLYRLRILYSYVTSDNVADADSILLSKNFDPKLKLLLNKKVEGFSQINCITDETECRYQLSLLETNDNDIKISVSTSRTGLLLLADKFYPGWKAYIDNTETSLYQANIDQRAILVPSGTHIIRFIYEPTTFKIGFLISLIGYLVITFLLGFRILSFFFRKDVHNI